MYRYISYDRYAFLQTYILPKTIIRHYSTCSLLIHHILYDVYAHIFFNGTKQYMHHARA